MGDRPKVTDQGSSHSSLLWPREARLRNLTYSATIYVSLTQTTTNYNEDNSVESTSSKTDIHKLCSVHIYYQCNNK